jgi:glutamine amidotransferase
MSSRLAIIDYGMGNLYSVRNTFASLGIRADIVGGPKGLLGYDKLILPGVGAFGDAMRELSKRRLVDPIRDFVAQGKPFLGICLGMQLLLEKSQEAPGVEGLGVVPGIVKKFSSRLKCPHMGWNEIEKKPRPDEIFHGLRGPVYAYFCHSYYCVPRDASVVIGATRYGVRFASIIRRGHVYGMQFHPEKSQGVGLGLLRNFIERC